MLCLLSGNGGLSRQKRACGETFWKRDTDRGGIYILHLSIGAKGNWFDCRSKWILDDGRNVKFWEDRRVEDSFERKIPKVVFNFYV